MTQHRKKLIEVALPLDAINTASAREKSIRHGHPSTLHLWWARRPLAACRAVLFAQLVDDPSAWPDLFPTQEAQEHERQALFAIIRELVVWENTHDPRVIGNARRAIAQSLARDRRASGRGDSRDDAVLAAAPSRGAVDSYLADVGPTVLDPFAGGGSIPLEAQRLGLRAIATDLNPVAVLLNKVQLEISALFAGMPPVRPDMRAAPHGGTGAQGLADDLRYYGRWLRDEAERRIGHLYPTVTLPGGKPGTVIAWLWARTVPSPDPAAGGAEVPLIGSYWICKRPNKLAWIEPVVDPASRTWRFEVRTGAPTDIAAVNRGTKAGRGDFTCILTGAPIPAAYTREQGQLGRIGYRMLAIVADTGRARTYLDVSPDHERAAQVVVPPGMPATQLPEQALGFRVQNYGYRSHAALYTPRQATALDTLAGLVAEARERVLADARAAGLPHGAPLEQGGQGAEAYADAVATLLGLAVSRRHDRWTAFSIWYTGGEKLQSLVRLSAVPMTWEFAEGNPFSTSTGNFLAGVELTAKAVASLGLGPPGTASQADARDAHGGRPVVFCTDPPYFDNVPYADLSDLFYVWLRRALLPVFPRLMATVLVPKADELVADPSRHGGRAGAERYFLDGMQRVIARLRAQAVDDVPVSVFYAFKQSENDDEGAVSTGWETFLAALVEGGFAIAGTWPVRTEQSGGLRNVGRNSLATSIVLVCRKRADDAPAITRADFRRLLRAELPAAVLTLQHGAIAPVDLAQASIGPGMAIFSRHARVLEADGASMSVRTALLLINQALDEHLADQEGELDSDSRFAVTWFETCGFDAGAFGEAETLAKARNVSVEGVMQAGILDAAAGKVRLLQRSELPDDWTPERDDRPTVWEATQHLIKRLDHDGEAGAAELLAQLGPLAEPARDLAYRLFTTCERRGWAEEARAYNGIVIAWPALEQLAGQGPRGQGVLL